MDNAQMIGMIENILFVAGDSVPLAEIAAATDMAMAELEDFLVEEIARREQGEGLLIRRFEDKIQLCTRPEYADLLRSMFGEKNEEELTQAMMETLSIVAYRQPVTRIEIEEIRGVNTSYTLNMLVRKGLVEEAGRKDALGRPILYRTSEEFLRHFGIASTKELPDVFAEEVI